MAPSKETIEPADFVKLGEVAKSSLRKVAIGCHGIAVGDVPAASPSTLPSSPYRMVTPVSSRGSVGPALPPSVRTSPTRSDLRSPVRVADATEDVRADLALRGLPTTDEFVSISTNLRLSAMVDDPFRMALEVFMARVVRSAGKDANTTSGTMSSGGEKAKLRVRRSQADRSGLAPVRSEMSRCDARWPTRTPGSQSVEARRRPILDASPCSIR
ncbi:BZ3500_MvSof-1268-A1-R1_Chr10-1g02617 [Microbotryum saponariae]|uniref:BZ3500_MvSof-1268-A1-R1_Chr10-1g02617 protein n=1 Tax=Microbotryum saponariae TaxID=289078 RepID=A0A2X0LXV2_9BASI|nr:BZ3500_MvSof-1268-A1-R1_Chr10-1g02617 [Microbotryum saponariae]SDA06106.1 BZ3501_MvSof-1269-A2-R1_Chr10-1g02218 [Microbotryum saponariae]